MSELSPELKALQTEIVKTVTDGMTELKSRLDIHSQRLDELDARNPLVPPGAALIPQGGSFETAGDKMVKQAQTFELIKQINRGSFAVGSFFPLYEQKTLIDTSALGTTTPGVLDSQTIAPVVPLPKRRLTIRDLFRSRNISAGRVQWIRETSFTNAASPQTEGSAKAESAMAFEAAYDDVATIAHWIPISKQAFDDAAAVREFVNSALLYGLKLKEEIELLNGDNLGDHLNGLTTQATAYVGTYNAVKDTYVDKLRHAILEQELAEETVSFFVLNPVDWHTIELIKDEASGTSNTGKYVIADPVVGTVRVPTLWGCPVVVTNSMTQGKFLCGDASAAIIGDRMQATVDVSENYGTYFVENKLAIRAEERIAFAVLRTSAFLYGSF